MCNRKARLEASTITTKSHTTLLTICPIQKRSCTKHLLEHLQNKHLQNKMVSKLSEPNSWKDNKQLTNYNQSHRAKDLPPLHLQQTVLIQYRDGKWKPATETQVGPEPRSYHCTTKTGKTFRRNRHHIQTTRLPSDDVLHDLFTSRSSAMKLPGYNTKNKEKKKLKWSDSVYITVDTKLYTMQQISRLTFLPLLKVPKSQ